MQAAIAYTILIWGVLFAVGWGFNRKIDEVPADDRPDGLTAYWVAIGCSYSLFATAVVLMLWHPYLPAEGTVFGLVVFGLAWMTFGAAGLPMLAGDIRRGHSLRRRRVNDAVLAEAQQVLDTGP